MLVGGKCQLTIKKMEAVVPLRNEKLNSGKKTQTTITQFILAVWLTITKGKSEELLTLKCL